MGCRLPCPSTMYCVCSDDCSDGDALMRAGSPPKQARLSYVAYVAIGVMSVFATNMCRSLLDYVRTRCHIYIYSISYICYSSGKHAAEQGRLLLSAELAWTVV